MRSFWTKQFSDFPTSIFNHSHNKVLSAQRNTHTIHILFTVVQNNCFLEGNWYLCVSSAAKNFVREEPVHDVVLNPTVPSV